MGKQKTTDLTMYEKHLLVHAANLGGWLSEGYMTGEYEKALRRLMGFVPPMFQLVPMGRGKVYQLTEVGLAAAHQIVRSAIL